VAMPIFSVGVSAAAFDAAPANASVKATATTLLKRVNDTSDSDASDRRRTVETEELMMDSFNEVFAWRERAPQPAPMHGAGKRTTGSEPHAQLERRDAAVDQRGQRSG
jgi:hypothetical protein